MSRKKLAFGLLIGLATAGVAALSTWMANRPEDDAIPGETPSSNEPLVDPRCYEPDYVRSKIEYVCRRLKLDPSTIIPKYFPHIHSGTRFTPVDTSNLRPLDVAKYIDHTILKSVASEVDVLRLCSEAKKFEFASVCVNGARVNFAKTYAPDVPVAAVVGFPLGAASIESKRRETEVAYRDGAGEIDMVVNVGKLKEGHFSYVFHDIKKVCSVKSGSAGGCVKVILETCYLSTDEIIIGCILSVLAGATFVKTSTGFGTGGAKVEHVRLMKTVVGNQCKVKASGGIRNFQAASNMIANGAERLGCSAGVQIVSGGQGGSGY